MAETSKVRLTYLIVLELARKYTRSLILGFIVGLVVSLLFWKIYPFVYSILFLRIDRIGIVGEYTPSTLPDSIQSQISFGLTIPSADGTPLPGLASGWEATNSGKTYVFTLREDKIWHDGTKVTSHDINYNIRGATIIPDGDYKITIHLQHPYSPFPALVSKPIFLPGLKGFGDYKVSGIELSGDKIKSLSLTPAQTGAQKRQKIYTFYHTEAQAIEAYKLGEIDELDELSGVHALTDWGKVQISDHIKYNRIVSLYFNTADPQLSDKKARQALAYGVPDLGLPKASSPIPQTSWAYSDNVRKYTYDQKQAIKLLKESSLASSSGTLVLSTFPAYLDIAQAIANSWKLIGVDTTIRVESTASENFQVLLSGQDLATDPDQYPFWHSTQTQTNITKYVNVKIDKLLEDGRQISETEARKKIYADFARRIVEDVPAVFLYYPKTYTIRRGDD